jgi:metal-sulfur cluster biosynthetic enzyme
MVIAAGKRKGGGMDLLEQVKKSLSQVVNPETGMDVIRMKLIRNLRVHNDGEVELTFRPYSMFCPIGFRQGIKIKKAVKSVPGVKGVHVHMDAHIHAERLEKLLGVVN